MTGEQRYTVSIATRGIDRKTKRVITLAHRIDEIRIRDYDRARFYPVVRDGLLIQRLLVTRANFHFSCPRKDIADLAQAELAPHIAGLWETLMKGAQEFGNQVCEERWMPKFEVTLTTGQQHGGEAVEKFFPFVWTIDRFAAFDPHDTTLLLNNVNGNFGGIRQYVTRGRKQDDIPASKCIHFVLDKDFDLNYGVPKTKSAIPFIELAEGVYDDMSQYTNRFAVPWTVGRYPTGRTPLGTDESGNPTFSENRDLSQMLVDNLTSGHGVSLPSEAHLAGGERKWDLETKELSGGEDHFVDKLKQLDDVIRIAISAPELASSQAPENGTYNLGEVLIDLYLANIEADLDKLVKTTNEQLVKRFVLYNFGADAPECKLIVEPVDLKLTRMLLSALAGYLGSGQPIQDANGNLIYPDWPKLLEDKGIPTVTVAARAKANDLRKSIEEKLRSIAGSRDWAPAKADDEGADI